MPPKLHVEASHLQQGPASRLPEVSQEQHAGGIGKVLHIVTQAGCSCLPSRGKPQRVLCTGSSMQRGLSSDGQQGLPSLAFCAPPLQQHALYPPPAALLQCQSHCR